MVGEGPGTPQSLLEMPREVGGPLSPQPAFWPPPPAWGELTGGVFRADCQKTMVGGRKCAIRSFRAISTVWSEPHCKHSGGRGRRPAPGGGPCQLGWAPGRRGVARESSRPQQNVLALRRGNINVIIIILCI